MARMNRRTMLQTATALIGGAAVATGNVYGEEKAKAKAAPASGSSTAPNLHPPVVKLKDGTLRGLKEGKTCSFLGIRYAEAERFGPPKSVQPWSGIKNAQAWGPVCPIPEQTTVGPDELVFPHRYWIANEHCQYLNVWTQNLTPAVKKPVMVWMHGGGFTNGSSIESYAYDGRSLSEFGDVVVVSVNHRLNILGTLDLSAYGPQYANSRYTGTADLVVALQWVHDNIESFGGDPGNVMIFGQSGGGGKVVRMMHMPAAKGLFHKVSAQSGGNNTYRTTDPAASIKAQQTIAAHTLKNLNLTGDQIDKLKTVPYPALIAAGAAALRSASEELGRPLNWEVIADDHYVMREFCDWADGIPLMAGVGVQRDAGHAHPRRRPQERVVAEGNRRPADRRVRRQEERHRRTVQAGVPAEESAGRAVLRGRLATGREEPAGAQARKEQDAGLQLPVRMGVPDQRRNHVLPLLRARVLLPRPERAADPDGDRRRSGGDGAAGQGRTGVGQLRAHRQSEPARSGMEAVHDREPAGDGVRHRQRVGRAPRRQAGVAVAAPAAGVRAARPRDRAWGRG